MNYKSNTDANVTSIHCRVVNKADTNVTRAYRNQTVRSRLLRLVHTPCPSSSNPWNTRTNSPLRWDYDSIFKHNDTHRTKDLSPWAYLYVTPLWRLLFMTVRTKTLHAGHKHTWKCHSNPQSRRFYRQKNLEMTFVERERERTERQWKRAGIL